jgi:excisionase family DNA binding protein
LVNERASRQQLRRFDRATELLAVGENSLLSVLDVAEYLVVSPQHVRNLIRAGQLPADRIRRLPTRAELFLISETNLFEFLDRSVFRG